ncbi:sigma-70 family RNA polymerase sigma factor [Cellulomonas fimi]|uniref:Sigma-70 family RNA polymerase sigma factor n=1 Tax=Cellulomonas fimi TaxID=1708 RepID=A0A7Y0LWV2_CELFI|nr:sigma-70 family RNA polymerase sigma factor [Cellulomonas fimi]
MAPDAALAPDRTTATRRVPADVEEQLERHRRELTGYCYRMLGSAFDAEDAVQETMVRAWRAVDRFDGRSSLRSWMYRIATNVCFDSLNGTNRRALPMDLSASASPPVMASLGTPLSERTWLSPAPDGHVLPENGDPAEVAVARESVRLAFVAALQHLPARQRAVLILREVLRWKADEVATLLDTTVASVNSALQRARATLEAQDLSGVGSAPDSMDDQHAALLARYVEAFEAYDIEALVALLHEDATQSMPPYALWLQGPVDIGRWHLGPGYACRGSRMIPVMANGSPAFAQYKPSGPGGRREPWAIHVLRVHEGRVSSITNFLDTRLFALFGLPARLDAD